MEKVYFQPGEVVTLKQDVDNKPVMIVKSVDKIAMGGAKPDLLGITCMWFSTTKELQKERFSTKDLVYYHGQ